MSYITSIRVALIKWFLKDLEHESEYSRALITFLILYMEMVLLSDHLNMKP